MILNSAKSEFYLLLAKDEEKEFRTTENGVKFPIEKGKSVKESCEDFFAEKHVEDITDLLGEEIVGVKNDAAIEALLEKEGGHVKGAFERKDIGPIDLIWGDENIGLCHIIKRRLEEGDDVNELLENLSRVVTSGKRLKPKKESRYGEQRFIIKKDKYFASISTELRGNKMRYVLTAFENS